MIIYNVTLKVEADIVPEWVQWMEQEHMPELMASGLFTGYRLCRLLEQDESEGLTYSAQCHCASLDDYRTYIAIHAPEMREKGFVKFGNKFIAFRTVMEVVAESRL